MLFAYSFSSRHIDCRLLTRSLTARRKSIFFSLHTNAKTKKNEANRRPYCAIAFNFGSIQCVLSLRQEETKKSAAIKNYIDR